MDFIIPSIQEVSIVVGVIVPVLNVTVMDTCCW